MRGYRLHDAGWSRLVTARVRRPHVITTRLASRRRRSVPIPVDGRLVLLDGTNRRRADGTGLVSRRELLDRLVEALAVDGVDGVIASPSVLEDLTLLNVLERRLAVSTASRVESTADANFDAAALRFGDDDGRGSDDRLTEASARGLPVFVDVRPSTRGESGDPTGGPWTDWIPALTDLEHTTPTGSGTWCVLPAVAGLNRLADLTGFPVLVRDADTAVDPTAWHALYAQDLPLTVRGMVAGPSALFPDDASVAAATAAIVAAVRQPGR